MSWKTSVFKIYNHFYLKLKYRNKKINIYSYNVSKDVLLSGNNLIDKNVVVGEKCVIGDYSYVNSNHRWTIIDSNVRIGKFCSIGPGVTIGMGEHNYSYCSTHPFLYDSRYGFVNKKKDYNSSISTEIGNDVWIGANATIKKGVSIGDGAVIGMNAVVTKDVPPYSIVAGVPAKIIKYRFEPDVINKLLHIKWWNHSQERLNETINDMYNVNEYLKKNYKK